MCYTKNMTRKPNYRGLFIVGIALIAVGTSLINLQPQPVGVVFIAVGGLFILMSMKAKK